MVRPNSRGLPVLYASWRSSTLQRFITSASLVLKSVSQAQHLITMSSEIRQRQTNAAVEVEPISNAEDMSTATEAPQRPARQFRSRLWRTLFMLLLAASAYFSYQQGWLGGKEKPKIIYASR
jgi:hypothetical protein